MSFYVTEFFSNRLEFNYKQKLINYLVKQATIETMAQWKSLIISAIDKMLSFFLYNLSYFSLRNFETISIYRAAIKSFSDYNNLLLKDLYNYAYACFCIL